MFTYVRIGSDKRYRNIHIHSYCKLLHDHNIHISGAALSPHPCDIKFIILYNLLYHVFKNAQVDDVIWNNVKYYSVATYVV